MADERSPDIWERAKRWWPIAALAAISAALTWGGNITEVGKNVASTLDTDYHHRDADGALVQLARIPQQPSNSVVRYMATFENRSDDQLLVTAVVYGVQETANATSADVNATENLTVEAGPVQPAESYDLQRGCAGGNDEPLIPPFRIRAHTSGSFEIRIPKENTSKDRWRCTLEVHFKTNQGETNGIVP